MVAPSGRAVNMPAARPSLVVGNQLDVREAPLFLVDPGAAAAAADDWQTVTVETFDPIRYQCPARLGDVDLVELGTKAAGAPVIEPVERTRCYRAKPGVAPAIG